MKRKLFCEISPLTYQISVMKCRIVRHLKNLKDRKIIAKEKNAAPLPYLIYENKSLIRRTLGNVDPVLQENKAVNLSLAAPLVHGVLIHPGQIFSFWSLVGSCTQAKGYKEGLTISQGVTKSGIGGGMCQFTNLIHWLVLHSDLDIVEHHHHDDYDLFPDFKRKIPFGTGTSILYNYLDYRFRNNTSKTYQLLVWVDKTHLCAELRADKPLEYKVHIQSQNEYFSEENGIVYRNGEIYRNVVDKKTGNLMESRLIKVNHAKVLYDASHLTIEKKKN